MFTYQMVAKEINEIMDQASLAKSAAYEALVHAQTPNDPMCETKLADLEARNLEVTKLLKQLKSKMDYMRNQT